MRVSGNTGVFRSKGHRKVSESSEVLGSWKQRRVSRSTGMLGTQDHRRVNGSTWVLASRKHRKMPKNTGMLGHRNRWYRGDRSLKESQRCTLNTNDARNLGKL